MSIEDAQAVKVYNVGLVQTGPIWTFTYLKYVPGAVTVASGAGPVMTGPLSGCYIFTYTHAGPKVAHVGAAHGANDPATVAAKAAWTGLVADPTVTNITGTSPIDSFTMPDFQSAQIQGSAVPICVSYYAGGLGYAMLLTKVPANVLPPANRGMTLLRVGAVKQMDMQTWTIIQTNPKFS